MMRNLALVSMLAGATMLAGTAWGQAMTEFGAAAAGGTVGGAGGKKVSDGISAIFGKVNNQAEKAAAPEKAAAEKTAKQPALEVSPGVDTGDVPPPPPGARPVARKSAPAAPPPPVKQAEVVPVPPPPPPPPQMTAEDLKQINPGASREDVLKLGVPSARITMYSDGHLVEVYNYTAHGDNLGSVRLSDGAVASVKAR
jgi:hypothetical protein